MLLLIQVSVCLEYYIKDYLSDRYVTSEEKRNESPYFSRHAKPDLFDITENPSGPEFNIIKALSAKENIEKQHRNTVPNSDLFDDKIVYTGNVMEIAPYKDTLIYFPFYQGTNQFIYLANGEHPNQFKMMHKNKCISYNEEESVFELLDCDDSIKISWFSLVPPHEYKGQIEPANSPFGKLE